MVAWFNEQGMQFCTGKIHLARDCSHHTHEMKVAGRPCSPTFPPSHVLALSLIETPLAVPGSLITDRHVLTAAHCFMNVNGNGLCTYTQSFSLCKRILHVHLCLYLRCACECV